VVELDRTLPEPKSLSDFRGQYPSAPPPGFESAEFQPAKNATKSQRNAEQGGLCIYCEQTLDATWGHVEHVKPKSGPNAQSGLTFVYSNLVHSCDGAVNGVIYKHCGHTKGHAILALEPGLGCNAELILRTDATIEPLETVPEPRRTALRADIEGLLNLNHPTLKAARRSWLDSFLDILRADPSGLPEFLAKSPFRHILERLQ
jgi:uncharacterized protein (TIGR02646 family)